MGELQAKDAALETALEIELGAERAPDVAAALFGPRPEELPRRQKPERWLVAALLLVAASVVVAIATLAGRGAEDLSATQDPRHAHRVFRRDAYAPRDLDDALRCLQSSDELRIERVLVPHPDGKSQIRIIANPLEGLAALFGGGSAAPVHRAAEERRSAWATSVSQLLAGEGEEAPLFVRAPIELVWKVGERGNLVVSLEEFDDGDVRVGVQGMPRAWRGEIADALWNDAKDLTEEPLRAALRDRGIALGRRGLDGLPKNALSLRLYGLGPADVSALAPFTQLRNLDLRGCPEWIDAEVLAELARTVPANGLTLPHEGLEAKHLAALQPMKLEELFLGDPMGFLTRSWARMERDHSLGDEAASVLAGFPALHELTIEQSAITDEGLAELAGLPLRRLMIGSTHLDGSGFAGFPEAAAAGLRSIFVRGTGSLRPDVFDSFVRLPELRSLGFLECILPTASGGPLAEIRGVDLQGFQVLGCLFHDGAAEGLPAALRRFGSLRELRVDLLNGQAAEFAKVVLPIPVERAEILVGDPSQEEAARKALAPFESRHPDLRLSVDSW